MKELTSGVFDNYIGWMNEQIISDREIDEINNIAKEIRANSEVLVVIGIGGSYLGARAVIEALSNKYDKAIEVVYLGNSLSPLDLKETLDYLKTKDFSVNVISKSGATLEPALAFSYVKNILFDKYSKEEAMNRIIVTTDNDNGSLRKFSDDNKVKSFVIPDDIGGRFSVLTAVGLLPMAIAGVDIERLVIGAREAHYEHSREDVDNLAIEYAAMRNVLHKEGLDIELLINYEPRLRYFAEWWKQLYGESEGKDGKGIFPSSAIFTTDLHSLGQLIQDGRRNLFETHISFAETKYDLTINPSEEDSVSLGHLTGKTVNYVNKQARKGVVKAHRTGGVPIIEINSDILNEDSLGRLIYFFMLSCSISGLMLKVNPFNQPGVESYKSNMNKLLTKKDNTI